VDVKKNIVIEAKHDRQAEYEKLKKNSRKISIKEVEKQAFKDRNQKRSDKFTFDNLKQFLRNLSI
jgi:phage terminase large subunit-like protein